MMKDTLLFYLPKIQYIIQLLYILYKSNIKTYKDIERSAISKNLLFYITYIDTEGEGAR